MSPSDQLFPRSGWHLPSLVAIMGLSYLGICIFLDWRGFQPVVVDSYSYLESARTLLHTGNFSREASPGVLEPEYARTPGYPLLLAGALASGQKEGVSVAVYVQRLVWVIFVFCFVSWNWQGGNISRWVLLPPMLLLFLPVSIVVTSSVLTETAYTILAALGVAFLASATQSTKPWRAAMAGLLVGAATLIRPIGLHLPIALAACSLLIPRETWIRRKRAITLFLVLGYLLPGVWMGRNWHLSGHFSLSSLAGPGLALHREDVIKTLPSHAVETMEPPEKFFVQQVRQTDDVFQAWEAVRRTFRMDDFEAGEVASRVGLAAIRIAPVDYLETFLRNLGVTFASPSDGLLISGLVVGRDELRQSGLSAAVRERHWAVAGLNLAIRSLYLLLVVILPTWLLLQCRKRPSCDPLFLLGSAAGAYLILIPAALTITYDRFLFPVLPAVCLIYFRKHHLNSRLENQGG